LIVAVVEDKYSDSDVMMMMDHLINADQFFYLIDLNELVHFQVHLLLLHHHHHQLN
jgi:hypothetical protein